MDVEKSIERAKSSVNDRDIRTDAKKANIVCPSCGKTFRNAAAYSMHMPDIPLSALYRKLANIHSRLEDLVILWGVSTGERPYFAPKHLVEARDLLLEELHESAVFQDRNQDPIRCTTTECRRTRFRVEVEQSRGKFLNT